MNRFDLIPIEICSHFFSLVAWKLRLTWRMANGSNRQFVILVKYLAQFLFSPFTNAVLFIDTIAWCIENFKCFRLRISFWTHTLRSCDCFYVVTENLVKKRAKKCLRKMAFVWLQLRVLCELFFMWIKIDFYRQEIYIILENWCERKGKHDLSKIMWMSKNENGTSTIKHIKKWNKL